MNPHSSGARWRPNGVFPPEHEGIRGRLSTRVYRGLRGRYPRRGAARNAIGLVFSGRGRFPVDWG